MKQLDSLIDKLNTDVYASVTVYDNDTATYLHRNLRHEKIREEYATAEDFFEQLYASGHKNLTLYPRRKNGNNFKADGDSFVVGFGKQQKSSMENTVQKPAKKKKKKKNNSFGLNAVEFMDLKLAAHDLNRITTENQSLTAKNTALELENKVLLEEKLQRKYTQDKNTELHATIQGGIKQLPLIMKGLGYNIPTESAGLGASIQEEDESLSDVKKGLIQVIKASPDEMVSLLQIIYNKVNQNVENNVFAQDLQNLLHQHQMIVA